MEVKKINQIIPIEYEGKTYPVIEAEVSTGEGGIGFDVNFGTESLEAAICGEFGLPKDPEAAIIFHDIRSFIPDAVAEGSTIEMEAWIKSNIKI